MTITTTTIPVTITTTIRLQTTTTTEDLMHAGLLISKPLQRPLYNYTKLLTTRQLQQQQQQQDDYKQLRHWSPSHSIPGDLETNSKSVLSDFRQVCAQNISYFPSITVYLSPC